VQQICTLWTHDDNFARDEIVFNGDKFPELPTGPGSLLQIVAINSDDTVRDFHSAAKNTQHAAAQSRSGGAAKDTNAESHLKRGRRGSITVTIDENGSTLPGGPDIDVQKAYVFAPKNLPSELKAKHTNLQVRGT
jgi:hypothetical protein